MLILVFDVLMVLLKGLNGFFFLMGEWSEKRGDCIVCSGEYGGCVWWVCCLCFWCVGCGCVVRWVGKWILFVGIG